MTERPGSQLISKATRNTFREFLVSWTLHEIEMVFEEGGIEPDLKFEPGLNGARRTLVEQHYKTLDLSSPADARRLVNVFTRVTRVAQEQVSSAYDQGAARRNVTKLAEAMRADGFKFEDDKFMPTSPSARRVMASDRTDETISEVTRRNLFDEFRISGVAWTGKRPEREFLSRLVDLDALPSKDPRYSTFAEDIGQHCERNSDWPDDWVYTDTRLDLLNVPDKAFLEFLTAMVHPLVRDTTEAPDLVKVVNRHLRPDGWQLALGKKISGQNTYVAMRSQGTEVSVEAASSDPADVLSDEYVVELTAKADHRLEVGDFEAAITVSRTMFEAILRELELRLAGTTGNYRGDLQKQYKAVSKLLKMDHERPEMDDRFKDVVRGLTAVVNGLAPLRNKLSDAHARVGKPASHHARLVVNATKTMTVFLVDSYRFQSRRKSG